MINLLYIIDGGHFGGAEQDLLTIIRKMDKTQYRIKLCLLKPLVIFENELRDLGLSVFVLNTAGKGDIFSIFKLIRFMRQEKIKIVHSCQYASNTFGRIAAILARVPIIIAWEQGEILTQSPPRHHKIDRILAKFTDSIVACSKAAKEQIIRKENILPDKIRVIYNCVDLDKFSVSSDASILRRQLGIRPDEMLLGNVATLSNRPKGQEYLIRAMPEIIRNFPKTKLLLVGDGPSKSDFIQIINNLNLSNKVILTGFRKDIPEIMSTLDLYVCSSFNEALSISIIEAMSLKKAVVATQVGGNPEVVIQNRTGYLIPPKDVDALAQSIISLLANRDKMGQMGEAGFKRVKMHFSSELITKKIEALYKELLWKIHPRSQ